MDSTTSQRKAVVERIYELFNRLPLDPAERRASPVTAELLELFHEEVEFNQPAGQPEGAQFFKGREALRESWDTWLEMWESHHSHPEQVRERDERVLVLSRERFRGREGIELDHGGASIFTFAEGKIVRMEAFFDHDTACREFDRSSRV